MRLRPAILVLALSLSGCSSPEEKICSEGFALASDGNCYEVATGFGGSAGLLSYPFETEHSVTKTFDDHARWCSSGCQGVDFDSTNEPVYATVSGSASLRDGCGFDENADDGDDYGNSAAITTADGQWRVIHAHMKAPLEVGSGRTDCVRGGEVVEVVAGQLLGYSSNSGYTSGRDVNDSFYHLHLEVEFEGADVDPFDYPDGSGETLFILDSDGSYQYPAEVHEVTHDGYFSRVGLSGTELTVSGKVWAAEGIEKLTITVGDETNSSDPSVYCQGYGDTSEDCDDYVGSTTEDWFGPVTIDLGDSDLETGTHDVGLWVMDTEGVAQRVDVGGPIEYTGESNTESVDLDPGSVTLSSSWPTAGDTLTIEFELDNDGTDASGAYTVAAYLSSDTRWDSGDRELDTWSMTALSAGGTGSYSESVTIPSSTSAGTYRVILVVDPDDDIEETNESDNTAYSSSVTVSSSGSSSTVDLDASSPTVSSSSVTAGESVTIEFEIENDGSGSSGSYTAGAWLSTDTSWGSSDTELDTWSLTSLSAGATGSYSKSVTIPSSATAGSYRVIVVADPDDDIDESSESNNDAYSSTLTVSAASTTVDLDPGTPSLSSRTPDAGDSITVSGDVDNDGTGSSGTYTIAAYLSTNNTWSSGDTLLESWTESSISAGGTGSYSESVTIPSSTSSGTYYVVVVVDPDDDLSEVTETDNEAASSSVTVTAVSTTVDLDPGTPSVSSRTPDAGDSITVSGNVANDGTGSSGSYTMAAYLSTNTSWSSSADTLLETWTESSISAGGTGSYSESITIPSSTSSGTYYVIVVVDSDDDISEVTETDNTAYSSTVTVTGACTATDYWSPDSTSDTVEGRQTDGTADGTGNGVDLEIDLRDDGTGDVEFRVCKSGSYFAGSDIWVVFDEDESGAGVIFEDAVPTSSSSYCTSWQSLGVSSWGEGDLLGGDWHIESPSPGGTTWGPGCIDDGSTAAACWFFDGHDTLERTCY